MKISDIVNETNGSYDPLGHMGDVGSKSPHRGDPIISPDAFAGLPGAGKPRVSLQRAKELGVVKADPKVWRRGETSIPAPTAQQTPAQVKAQELLKGQGFKEPTPQEKLSAAAQTQVKATGEPVVTLKPGGLASRMLDKFFPEPKQKIEPLIKEPSDTPLRAVEPKSNMQQNIDYWSKAMPADTIGGKIVDKLMGIKKQDVDEAETPQYTKDQFLQWAKQYSDQYKVPLPLVLHSMYNETGWLKDPSKMVSAKSPTGARGVMQIQPEYAEKGYGIKVQDLFDPQKNIEAGVRGLARYLEKYKTPEKALAAYNAGPGGASKFIQTGDIKFLKPETRKYIQNYKDDVIHNLEKFYPKDKQKISQVATDILGTVVGAKSAQAQEIPGTAIKTYGKGDKLPMAPGPAELAKINKRLQTAQDKADVTGGSIDKTIQTGKDLETKIKAEIEKNKQELEKLEKSKVAASDNSPKSLQLTPDQVKKLPPVDMFGHILPSIDWNQQGGIKGISTKPYTLPDGTVITDKRDLDKIRSLQKTSDNRTISGPITPAQTTDKSPELKPIPTPSVDKPKSSARQEFEQEFAKQRAAQGAGGTFDWTNPTTGKTSKFTTDYAVEPKSKVAESINTELTEILKLAGRT